MRLQVLAKRNLISHDVIANTGQFIAQRFGGETRICLGNFPVIVAAEALILSACQMGSFGKCPAQIPVAIFTVAVAFAFTIGKPL